MLIVRRRGGVVNEQAKSEGRSLLEREMSQCTVIVREVAGEDVAQGVWNHELEFCKFDRVPLVSLFGRCMFEWRRRPDSNTKPLSSLSPR